MAFRWTGRWQGMGLAALLLAVLLLAGCIPIISVRTVVTVVPVIGKVCTQAGCIDTLRVDVQGKLPQQFKITLIGSDGSELTADCDLARLEESHNACDALEVEYYGEYFLFRTAPTEVVLRIEWEGGEIEQEFTPPYEWFYPNGPDCTPKCKQGKVELQIP